jgi:hypothetical protein
MIKLKRYPASYIIVLVDQVEEDKLEHQEQEDLSSTNYPEDHVWLLVQSLQVLRHVKDQKGDGVDHAVDHQQPVQPPPRDDTQNEDQHEAAERIPIDTDQLSKFTSTSGSFNVSHFMNFKTIYSNPGTPKPIV